jgi:hypothetical protein
MAPPATFITVNLTGLNDWQDGEPISLFSSNTPVLGYLIGRANGSTVTAIDIYDFKLIDGALGDRAVVTRLAQRTMQNGQPYTALDKTATLAPFAVVSGRTTTVSGTFVSVPQDLTTTISVDQRVFAAQIAATSGAVVSEGGIHILGEPDGLEDPAPLLAATYPPVAQDVVAVFQYGNPFPVRYQRAFFTWPDALRSYPFPGGSVGKLFVRSSLTGLLATDQIVASAIVGPVESVTINGLSPDTSVSGVGAMPIVAWSAPQLGAGAVYRLQIWKQRSQPVIYFGDVVGSISTPDPRLAVPPGILEPGSTYVFDITSTARESNRRGDAQYLTGLIQP